MATPEPAERDQSDDEARRWAAEIRRKAKRGELKDDAAYLKRKLSEEKRKLRQK